MRQKLKVREANRRTEELEALKVVAFPTAHPSSLIFSFSLNGGVCKQDWGPCLLMRTKDKQSVPPVCVFACNKVRE